MISFADNDVEHIDTTGADHEAYTYGLKKSLFNYMQGIGLDEPLHKWFDHKTPRTTVKPDYIVNILNENDLPPSATHTKIIFLGTLLKSEKIMKSKKGNQWELMQLSFLSKRDTQVIQVDVAKGEWLLKVLSLLSPHHQSEMTLGLVKEDYEKAGLEDFELFWDNKPISQLYKVGLLRL
jgi:hypothetical protein